MRWWRGPCRRPPWLSLPQRLTSSLSRERPLKAMAPTVDRERVVTFCGGCGSKKERGVETTNHVRTHHGPNGLTAKAIVFRGRRQQQWGYSYHDSSEDKGHGGLWP